MTTLKVRARKHEHMKQYALVSRYDTIAPLDAMQGRIPQHVGFRMVADDKAKGGMRRELCADAVEIADTAEHRQHIADGDLWAADEETANACGVKFDPNFGGDENHKPKPPAKPATDTLPPAA